MCVKLVIYKDYIEMHGQQNIIITSGVAQRFYLLSFVCLRTAFSFDYCTNTVPTRYVTFYSGVK
jgi:hypothetical protein